MRVGDAYTAGLVAALDAGIDAMGERGEFHTLVHVWDAPAGSAALGHGAAGHGTATAVAI